MGKLPIAGMLMLCLAQGVNAAEPFTVLSDARQQVVTELTRLDDGLRQAAERLGKTGLSGDEARAALAELCKISDHAVDCAAIDPRGKIVTVEPAAYRHFEGADISGQKQVRKMMKTRKPVMSRVFRAIEGFNAVDVEYPVFAPDGRFLGAASLLFKPEKLLERVIQPLVNGTAVDIWVMEKTGRILYDADAPQIGLNLFTSPHYKPFHSLVMLGKGIAAKSGGAGNYTFSHRETHPVVRKDARWQTASLYGTDWRLVMVRVAKDEAR